MIGTALLLATLLPAQAQDPDPLWGSEPQPMLFTDQLDVFEGLEYDTGVVPSGSLLGVRVYTASAGGYAAEIEAMGDLWWPDPLTHQVTGLPQGGWMALVADLSLNVDVVVDLSDIGQGVIAVPVWSEGVILEDEVVFDGLLLEDSMVREVEATTDGDVIGPWETTQSIITGVNLVFRASAFPRASTRLRGLRLDTVDPVGGSSLQVRESDQGQFDVPVNDPGKLDLKSTWTGQIDAGFELVVVPEVEVCAPIIGCISLVRPEIGLPLDDLSTERAFDPVPTRFPLPVLDEVPERHDFGQLRVGDTDNLEIPLANLGLYDLQGEAVLEGDEAFSVYPASFYAPSGVVDGVVVSFSPAAAGPATAVLELQSNDPARPSVEIPLLGQGYLEQKEAETGSGAESETVPYESQCGCATGSGGPLAAWGLAPLALVLVRRRARG